MKLLSYRLQRKIETASDRPHRKTNGGTPPVRVGISTSLNNDTAAALSTALRPHRPPPQRRGRKRRDPIVQSTASSRAYTPRSSPRQHRRLASAWCTSTVHPVCSPHTPLFCRHTGADKSRRGQGTRNTVEEQGLSGYREDTLGIIVRSCPLPSGRVSLSPTPDGEPPHSESVREV
jgi:hypothetical protein